MWNENISYFENRPLKLEESAENIANFSKSDKEIKYFESIFTEELLLHICNQTNLYARQERCVVKSGKKTTKVSSNWQDITVPELKAFLGMLILMGVHQLPQLGNYWSSDPILAVTAISSVMTKLRYKKIVENLHCNDNSTCVKKGKPGYDKLHKIRPVIRAISNKLCKVYKPSSVLAVDECMVAFKGRSTLKQYMPMKPVKRGYREWCSADASTGFIINFDIYTGKRDTNDTSEFTLGEEVVLTLTKAMDGSKRLVAFDNYFTTVRIKEELQSHGLYGIGTVRPNRKDLPDMLEKNSKLSRGEFEFAVRSCVAAVKWQDSKPVRILSNYHNPKHVTTVLRRNKDGSRSEVFCPLAVAEHNKIMGGVDRFDQLPERYAVGSRSRKWWHRLFFFLVDLAVVNSYVMWKLQKTEADQLTVRLHLARQLFSGFSSRKRRGRRVHFQTPKRGVSGVPDEVRLEEVGTHFPTKGTTNRRCRQCSTKNKEKRTKIMCSNCRVPLCVAPCFSKFHSTSP
ncbi:piggyBac transposable element-derived protein 4-like [Schistocerca piceifrons]|uniref:piggyBac transposable element-derived protein 4-like n=1 Tax=Schistocerca piceifrons TaxID=274613 RepID=UPI001F5EDC71|nr:piggyBac transposable element-derived protein 4-like [Schistocerca piceifrons]